MPLDRSSELGNDRQILTTLSLAGTVYLPYVPFAARKPSNIRSDHNNAL